VSSIVPESQTVIPVGETAPATVDSSPLLSMSGDLLAALQGEDGEDNKENRSPLEAQQETKSSKSAKEIADETGLTPEEEAQVDKLKERDQEVRAHEQAHALVGGQYAGAPTYDYQTGPDNRQYAVGGEVKIDTAPVPGDPAATIDKMDIVIKAALAPAEPSGQDRAVASQAAQKRTEAQTELNAQKQAERNGESADENQADGGIVPSTVDPSAVINLFA